MRQIIKTLFFSLALAACSHANNIHVANVVLKHQDAVNKRLCVEFDLSWENSWRNDSNHDAAWVFVKFRAPGSNEWEHAYLSTDPAAHVPLPVGATLSVGVTEVDGLNQGVGVFVYSDSSRTGDVNYAPRVFYGNTGAMVMNLRTARK